MRSADFGFNLHIEGSSKHMVVYEYMSNSSLQKWLFII
jgi:hypothetical protein